MPTTLNISAVKKIWEHAMNFTSKNEINIERKHRGINGWPKAVNGTQNVYTRE